MATKRSINVWVAEWMENLAEGIKPHLDEQGHKEYALDLGDGWQGYRLADDLSEQVRDLIDCMNELRVLSSHISSEDTLSGDLTWVVFTSFKLGRLAEKIQIRRFEPLVMSRRRSDAAVDEINSKRPKAEELKHEAEKAIQEAKVKYPKRKGDRDFIKSKAAESLGIKKRALNIRLGK